MYILEFWVELQCCGTFSCRWPWGRVSVQLTNIYSHPTFPLFPSWPSHLILLCKSNAGQHAKFARISGPEIALTKFDILHIFNQNMHIHLQRDDMIHNSKSQKLYQYHVIFWFFDIFWTHLPIFLDLELLRLLQEDLFHHTILIIFFLLQSKKAKYNAHSIITEM